jgi:DNA adenine methylase
LPNNIRNLYYYEPFIGGGALFFNLLPKKATISDWNWELTNLYTVVRDNVEELMEDLKKHVNEREHYFTIRALDRIEDFKKLSNVERASRTIFLNKTSFNGLYRMNQKG